jgi:hypothetical protein
MTVEKVARIPDMPPDDRVRGPHGHRNLYRLVWRDHPLDGDGNVGDATGRLCIAQAARPGRLRSAIAVPGGKGKMAAGWPK